jgi:DNA-binding NtrC family response regulator
MTDVASPRRPRVMILDDEQKVAEALGRALSDDYEVEIFSRPQAALDRLVAGERFDVVICDLVMPDMSGVDFCAAASRAAPSMAERFIFMTGGVPTLRTRYFLKGGASPCIEKPFEIDQLRALITLRISQASGDHLSEPRTRSGASSPDAPVSSK